MASLTNNKIKDTYQSLVKFNDNGNITTSAKRLTDGFGNNSPFFVSTTQIGIGVTPTLGYDLHVNSNTKIGGNLEVGGNLTVSGTLTYLNVEDLATEDPLIKLARNNADNLLDIGFYGKYVESTVTKYKGLFNDADDDKWKLFIGTSDEPTTIVNTGGTGYTVGTLVANLEGNVTGTVSSLSNHDTDDLSEGTTNLYFTTARARASFTEGTGVTITNGEIAIGQDVSTTSNVTFGDITGSAISGTTGTFSSNTSITGDTTTPHSDNAFIVYRGSDGSTALRVQNSGEVVVQNNYLYASGAGTSLYVQNGAVIRGDISNDGGNVSVADNLDVTGDVSMSNGNATGKFAVKSTGVHASYDFYNDGTTYLNGATTVDDNLTVTGNLYANGIIYDSSNDAGTSGQVLSSTGTGTNWIDNIADVAKRIDVTVKNVSGGSLAKGTVVHAAPTATPPSGNVIEVIAADANDATKMPSIGVLNETIADEAEGEAVMFGAVSGIDTSSFSIGDELYVSETAGEFTATKPTAYTSQVQKIAVVIKSHASNGLIKVFGAGRANDVPNRVERNINFTDDSILSLGTDQDLKIYHNATNSFIENETGNLYIFNKADDKDVIFSSDNGSGGTVEYFRLDGSTNTVPFGRSPHITDNVKLYFGNDTANDASIKWDSTASQLFIDGVTKFLSDVYFTGNAYFGDNDKLYFGDLTTPDLEIYHDTGNSVIKDNGTGSLYIMGSSSIRLTNVGAGEHYAKFFENGAVELMYDNSKKFETTSSGVSITGAGVFSGNVDVDGGQLNVTSSSGLGRIELGGSGGGYIDLKAPASDDYDMRFIVSQGGNEITTASGDLKINTSNTLAITVNSSQHTSFRGNITLEGQATNNIYMQSSTANTYLWNIIARNDDYFLIGRSGVANDFYINPSGNATFAGSVTANSFIKSGGTSSQYLMADGSVSTGGAGVDGSGTANDIAMWSDSDTLTDAPIAISGNNAAFAGNIAISAGKKIQLSGAADSTHHIYHSTSDDFDIINYSTGFKLEHYQSGTQMTMQGSTGNLGIGTTSPAEKLEVSGGHLKITNSGNTNLYINANAANADATIYFEESDSVKAKIQHDASNDSMLFTDGSYTDTMTLKGGNVGIGTTSPSAKLTIQGTNSANGGIKIQNSGGNPYAIYSDNNDLLFTNGNGSTTALTLSYSGDLTMQGGRIYVKESDLGNTAIALTRDVDEGYVQLFSSGTQTIQIRGNGNTYFNGGSVGIGTDSPSDYNSYADNLVVADSAHSGISIVSGTTSLGTLMFADGTGGTSGYRGRVQYDHNTDSMNFHTAAAERMRIDSSGNVGIGITNPAVKLEIQDSTHTTMKIRSGNNDNILFAQALQSDEARIGTDTNSAISFFTNTGRRMTITTSGNVGIGTNLPDGNLEVVTTSTVSGASDSVNNVLIGLQAANRPTIILDTADTTYTNRTWNITNVGSAGSLFFGRNGLDVLVMKNDGKVGIGTSSPSAKLDVRKSGTTAAHGDTDLFVGDSGAASSTAQVQIHGGTSGFSNLYFSDASAYNVGGFIYNHSSNYLATNVNGSERMRITSSGLVGIGITNPSYNLHVVDTIGTRTLKLGHGNSYARITTDDASKPLDLQINSQNALRVATNKNIGIGTDSPSTRLTVKDSQDSSFDSGISVIRSASSQTGYINMVGGAFNFNAPSGVPIRFRDGGTANVTIDGSGKVGIGTTSPSRKLTIGNGNGFVNNQISLLDGGGTEQATIAVETTTANDLLIASKANLRFFTGSTIGGSTTLPTSESMRINSSGNVGMGGTGIYTTVATLNLDGEGIAIKNDRNGSSNNWTYIRNTATGSSSNLQFVTGQGNSLTLNHNTSATFSSDVQVNGKIGINETAPATLLSLAGVKNTSIITLKSTTNNSSWSDGDKIGGINFYSEDGSGSGAGIKGSISYIAKSSSGGSTGMTFRTSDSSNNDVERMFIDNSGVEVVQRLGIQAINASYNLYNNGTTYLNGTTTIDATLYITNGRLAVGTPMPQHQVDAYSATSGIFAGRFVYAGTSGSDCAVLLRLAGGSTSPSYIDFIYGTAQTGSITTNGSSTFYLTSSDYRLKENVVELNGALDRIDNLKPKRFNFISDSETTVDGFLAHEVAEVVPEAIHGEKDAVNEYGKIKAQGIDQSKLVPLLVAAVQELRAEVKYLKDEINKLK